VRPYWVDVFGGVDLFKVLDGGAAICGASCRWKRFPDGADVLKPAVRGERSRHAGGRIIAAACDHRVMADGTGRIGVPELMVGVPFPSLPLEIVGSRVPASVLRQLVLTGRTVRAGEAREMGLVDEVAEPDALVPRACEVAEQLARIPPASFALTKRGFTDLLLDRARAAADRDADVSDVGEPCTRAFARMSRRRLSSSGASGA
jgi:enoyl-CoA hydratase/carnithine racemase